MLAYVGERHGLDLALVRSATGVAGLLHSIKRFTSAQPNPQHL